MPEGGGGQGGRGAPRGGGRGPPRGGPGGRGGGGGGGFAPRGGGGGGGGQGGRGGPRGGGSGGPRGGGGGGRGGGPRGGGGGGQGGRGGPGGPRGGGGRPQGPRGGPQRGYVEAGVPRVWRSPYGVLTENAVIGVRVYGEKLFTHKGRELRAWNPRRSKLAALLMAGTDRFSLQGDESVLYLGAASGTTVSHLSDILRDGRILAVEKSARSFRDLLDVARARGNVDPSLTDARATDQMVALLPGGVDMVYQDIAQRDQAEIFLKAVDRFLRPGGLGILMVKARSVSISANPRDIYDRIERTLVDHGLHVLERVSLEPWEMDHAALLVERPQQR